jgi:hypothetical protein
LEAQTPQPSSRTRTWPGPGSGRSTSSIRMLPGAASTAARIVVISSCKIVSAPVPA